MDSEYDCKFEEMKKYIPFLENMITRLESTSSSSNPRQAQLDKIRSLRDLLSNKKKRMKMENLLKCEQVLVNSYAKVEQRDTLSTSKKELDSVFSIDAPTSKEKSDLEAVRNKLKTVVKRQENVQDTLPEILPRSEINDVHTSGTKEPALFQRRPNQPPNHSNKDTNEAKTSSPGSDSKRNYTRVLVSPETSSRRWSSSEKSVDKPLFSRSPRKSPRRSSPSYYKKERKKSKDRQSRKQRDLNITLNVPEESLNSLNTKDIWSRIINCSDGDVDIDTLRELRKQILGELQKTGAKDDISDLILKSYNKNKNLIKKKKPTKKEEIEEGELSDSESEAIESIYGSLVVKEPGLNKVSSENDTQPRKIQICLVINSDSKSETKTNGLPRQDSADFAARYGQVTTQEPSGGDRCGYCKGGGHSFARCEDFLALEVRRRRGIVQQRRLCFYCMGPHFASGCDRYKPCSHCGGDHHPVLCKNRAGQGRTRESGAQGRTGGPDGGAGAHGPGRSPGRRSPSGRGDARPRDNGAGTSGCMGHSGSGAYGSGRDVGLVQSAHAPPGDLDSAAAGGSATGGWHGPPLYYAGTRDGGLTPTRWAPLSPPLLERPRLDKRPPHLRYPPGTPYEWRYMRYPVGQQTHHNNFNKPEDNNDHKKTHKATANVEKSTVVISTNKNDGSLSQKNTKDTITEKEVTANDINIASKGEKVTAPSDACDKNILKGDTQFNSKDDISDLILKSYNKNKNLIKKKKPTKKEEIEEGELSDSESEAIESIYGSLVVKEPGLNKVSSENDTQPRKIQICLVINSDSKSETKTNGLPRQDSADFAARYGQVTTQEPSGGDRCGYCKGGGHSFARCEDFLALEVRRRRGIVQQRRLCFYCMGPHFASGCDRNKPCSHCGGDHHPVLCKNRAGQGRTRESGAQGRTGGPDGGAGAHGPGRSPGRRSPSGRGDARPRDNGAGTSGGMGHSGSGGYGSGRDVGLVQSAHAPPGDLDSAAAGGSATGGWHGPPLYYAGTRDGGLTPTRWAPLSPPLLERPRLDKRPPHLRYPPGTPYEWRYMRYPVGQQTHHNNFNKPEDNNDHKKTHKATANVEKSTVVISTNKNDGSLSQKNTKDTITEKEVTANDINIASKGEKVTAPSDACDKNILKGDTQFKANFYKPLTEPSNVDVLESDNKDNLNTKVENDSVTKTSTSVDLCNIENTLKKMENSAEIPLLHERTIEQQPPDSTLSEIDILQALKNEILSEIPVPGTESTTPLLHQPKVIKVANAQASQLLPKKRITIEKYKEKSVTPSQLHSNKVSHKDEHLKKTSLKLTDKECERFFNVPKISFDDEDESLDEDVNGDIEASDVYGDLVPKSPDREDSSKIESTPPIIIPTDPIKSVPTNYKADVDMRALPLLSPNSTKPPHVILNNISSSTFNDLVVDKTKADIKIDQNHTQNRPVLIDPRVRRDLIPTQSPNPHAGNPERTPRQIFAGVPSNSTSTPIMTPNARTYEMTPTYQSFEIDQSNRKHVYASMSWENTDLVGDRRTRIDEVRESCWKSQADDSQNKRFTDSFNSDHESYRFSENKYFDKNNESSNNYTEHSSLNNKDIYEKKRNEQRESVYAKSSYSPRKNYRDPRMRKLATNKTDRRGSEIYSGLKSGIVYSNDNIVTGSILASGYGVKNYKIPKIKRSTPVKEDILAKTDSLCKNDDKERNCKNTNDNKEKELPEEKLNAKEQRGKVKTNDAPLEKPKEVSKKLYNRLDDDVGDITEKRLTRSSKKSVEKADTEMASRARKFKKVIYDSDSDDNIDTKSENTKVEEKKINFKIKDIDSDQKGINVERSRTTKQDVEDKHDLKKKLDAKSKDIFSESEELDTGLKSDDVKSESKDIDIKSPVKETKDKDVVCADHDSSFGMDELEMFSDNIVTDPVIENITALIAELDNDLNTSKSDSTHNFTKEITLENMMQNISSPAKDRLLEVKEKESAIVVEQINKISNEHEVSFENQIKINTTFENPLASSHLQIDCLKNLPSFESTKDECCLIDPAGHTPTQSDAENNKDNKNGVDSTTETEENGKPNEDSSKLDENADGCSTPDSTINTEDTVLKTNIEETLPGSTNEVTSTESIELKPGSAKEITTGLDSIGSLLSILQDKSKIKELLSMLGDQSNENEKIKKKLEKLSELVSDDEESCDAPKTKIDLELEKVGSSEITDINRDRIETIDVKEMESIDDEQLSRDSSMTIENSLKIDDDDCKTSDIEADVQRTDINIPNVEVKPKKKPVKKTKYMKKAKEKAKKGATVAIKRITRAAAAEIKPGVKKIPRELMQLQEDIKEMFIRDEVLSATGIRMCRLAKLVDEKISPAKDEQTVSDPTPVVVLEKFKDTPDKDNDSEKNKKKKVVSKLKLKTLNDCDPGIITQDKTPMSFKHKPGPKSKTKNKKDSDPYTFQSDLVCDTVTEKASEDVYSSNSDSEGDSLTSSKSFSSTECLSDLKKKTKRKRRGWQAGVIKTKIKKKKEPPKKLDSVPDLAYEDIYPKESVPDLNCFTDRNYCFQKNQISYSCRLCSFTGTDIVLHYRNQHPHTEIPLSRMTPEVAKYAIEQCVEVNFKAISKITSDKYVCIFCFKEFVNSKSVLETFFWHIVSMHTGEYKQNCSQCDNVHECPFNLDIPPPPKDTKGQLIGFICKKCNFTQISLENLKTHVIVRHNDEQTAVYTINLSMMTKKALSALLMRCEPDQSALKANSRTSEQALINEKYKDSSESDDEGVKTRTSARKSNVPITPPIQSKITFEGDDNVSEASDFVSEASEEIVKTERIDTENVDVISNNEESLPSSVDVSEIDRPSDTEDQLTYQPLQCSELQPSSDIINCPHFKINVTESGVKEYLCCINDNYHFKTTLLISMKKHVQSKHSENWDGYCYVCKVIVTPQGSHRFTDCLQHYLDKHMDNFPFLEKETKPVTVPPLRTESPANNPSVAKSYINVRPLSDLITRSEETTKIQESVGLPKIQSVRSLGPTVAETPQLNPTYSAIVKEKQDEKKIIRYEGHQAEVASKKYYLVIEAMMTPDNLVKVFKCSGRYCLYATDSIEEALAHATTHQRVGGVDASNCCYCDFDAAGNAVDLVMHIFKSHGNCRYCCQQCFYRAASSQAVGAHISRVHGETPVPGSVLRTTTISTIPVPTCKMLTREEAVSYYICGHSDHGDSCKFRTYTPDKFCDHLLQRHTSASAHPCHLCSADFATPADLVQHMKNHGLKLYQCTWCIHGADNETEMLAHVSMKHPNKQPQAYIRIITNKDGCNTLRVLPLAFLNKYKVPTKDVTPSATKEHPVREAERSIQMEALIGPFMTEPIENHQITESPLETTETLIQTSEIPEELIETAQDTKPVVDVNVPKPTAQALHVVQPPSPTPSDSVSSTPVTVLPSLPDTAPPKPSVNRTPTLPVVASPAAPPVTTQPLSPPTTINTVAISSIPGTQMVSLKLEPIEKEKVLTTDVVVLDSDEENLSTVNRTALIDLSEDEASTSSKQDTPKIISSANLYTCPQCKQICKNMGGFKKHIYSCVTDISRSFQCPHCTYHAENLEKITWHYVADHTQKNTYECSLCGALLISENFGRKHMRSVHKENNIMFTPDSKVTSRFVITVTQKEKVLPKRKYSGPEIDSIQVKRKFNPQEIDQLPISPILDQLVYCSICEFNTKVRLNMVRHLQFHNEQQPVPQTAPVNPVPHLESNEKHFDKMVNLASSSIISRAPDKSRPEHTPAVNLLIPPEAASRYPKYVPERQRYTCGAKSCSYISVDEDMLRHHWVTLHSGTSDFRCVHCPPHQLLDTSKPLTANRIVSHLKMHDSTLYACSSCCYYHFKRGALEKHLSEIHKTGRLMIVREEYSAPISPTPVQSNAAPTMDLKPWQCGLCKFKSMLRPEVVEHCSKFHQSKMQFKCSYCPFRTSSIENVIKHQNNSHAGKPEEVFYYYYREGSVPDDSDGTPRWVKQRQKAGPIVPEVKVESSVSPTPKTVSPAVTTPLTIDLNLVKKEANVATEGTVLANMDDLCKRFGQFCEPNGIKYKCSLCSVVMEDTRELMQSHLYEELNYRKWSCGLCSYKAFHRAGLTDHMASEHRRQYDHIELPTDINIERWVTAVLDHQAAIITKHKDNLSKQKIIVENNKPGSSAEVVVRKEPVGKYSDKDLETAFGSFGSPNCTMFCCPKCGFLSKDEAPMRDHLEMELNKIRWCCTNCPENFQTYHEAQFHCKGHDGPSRPKEALRDPSMRASWVSTTIQKQKVVIQNIPTTSSPEPLAPENINPDNDNSLLVVRYEERVPTPDQVAMRRKRTAAESEDEKLLIDEVPAKKKQEKHCPHCDYKSTYHNVKMHMLTHFGLKPYTCGYCPFNNSTKRYVTKHIEQMHPNKPINVKLTELPPEAINLGSSSNTTLICLVCEKAIPEADTHTHLHNNVKPEFSSSSIVHKCCICSNLYGDVTSLTEHNNTAHPGEPVNYALYKLGVDRREFYKCVYCNNKFKYVKDCRAHHLAAHPTLEFKVTIWSPVMSEIQEDDIAPVVQRRCAKKSTSKLPSSFAKKSTTKLPYTVPSAFEDEYSYYGREPTPLQQYANVTTLMSFCNTMMPFSLKQLSEHINIEPRVMVTDIKHSSDCNKLQM